MNSTCEMAPICMYMHAHTFTYTHVHTQIKWKLKEQHIELKSCHGCWRNGTMVMNIHCSFRRPWFGTQHPHDDSQPFVTQGPGNPTTSSNLPKQQAGIWYTYMHQAKHTHKLN